MMKASGCVMLARGDHEISSEMDGAAVFLKARFAGKA